MTSAPKQYLALSGGVGGAKLALGLGEFLSEDQLTIVANTGDDFSHLGLHISPDLDSVMYALSGLHDKSRGWGVANESWNFLDMIVQYGDEHWFQLGDKDLATHVLRTNGLKTGQSLSEVTERLCRSLGIQIDLVPMSDDPVRTRVHSGEAVFEFQEYFVREQCKPKVSKFEFAGIDKAKLAPKLLEALQNPDLAGIIICPSNPYVSVDPILKLGNVSALIESSAAPVIAVSPIVDGKALKGPAAKMMAELGKDVSALSVAKHYQNLIDIFVLDETDRDQTEAISDLGIKVVLAQSIMKTKQDKIDLAEIVIGALGGVH